MASSAREWIEADETAKQFLTRVFSERPFLPLPPPLHRIPLRPGNVVEIVGPSPSSKTRILMQAAINCILPKEWKGVNYGGLERLVMFVDLDCCFDVLSLSRLLKQRIIRANGIFEKSFNATFIALIPKSIYKIISKLLTERLKKVVHKLVDAQQMAFIKGRQILDAILIANECTDARIRSKAPGRWDLEKFGSNGSTFASVLVNGSPAGFFPSQRGLRQGDPLSPFLFIIAMEGLNDMLQKAQTNNWIRGFKI
ncbi:hypothetical protein MTR67_000539 [Solanum verrucosum]|uniref:Reverse transcriptase domain-containing protein n=1 Tax=Solanum verrucosum TaxID=315347 RepID=A0AAF0PLI1_SOLVR|nr:hypothetical protein MTR67_000539 [Solanum verrucosum]